MEERKKTISAIVQYGIALWLHLIHNIYYIPSKVISETSRQDRFHNVRRQEPKFTPWFHQHLSVEGPDASGSSVRGLSAAARPEVETCWKGVSAPPSVR